MNTNPGIQTTLPGLKDCYLENIFFSLVVNVLIFSDSINDDLFRMGSNSTRAVRNSVMYMLGTCMFVRIEITYTTGAIDKKCTDSLSNNGLLKVSTFRLFRGNVFARKVEVSVPDFYFSSSL